MITEPFTNSPNAILNISPPDGPIANKWIAFVMGGEEGWLPDVREWAFVGSVGTGKTSALVAAMLMAAMKYPGARLALVSSTRANLERSVLQTLEQMAQPLIQAKKYRHVKRDNRIEITTPEGEKSNIYLFGLDNPNADKLLVGTEWLQVFVDQLERIPERKYEILLTRIRQKVYTKDGKLAPNLAKSTANIDEGKRTWLYRRFQSDAYQVGKDIYVKDVERVIDGVVVRSRRAYIRAKFGENKSLNPNYVEMLALAGSVAEKFMADDWEDSLDIIYYTYDDKRNTLQRIPEQLKDYDMYVGVDVGANTSPNVALFFLVHRKNKNMLGVSEYVEYGNMIRDFGADIASILKDYPEVGDIYLYVDPSAWNSTGFGKTLADELYEGIVSNLNRNVFVDKAFQKGSVRLDEKAYLPVNKMLESGDLKISPSMGITREVLLTTTYEDVHRDRHPRTDVSDALRYVVYNVPQRTDIDDDKEDDAIVKPKKIKWWGYN